MRSYILCPHCQTLSYRIDTRADELTDFWFTNNQCDNILCKGMEGTPWFKDVKPFTVDENIIPLFMVLFKRKFLFGDFNSPLSLRIFSYGIEGDEVIMKLYLCNDNGVPVSYRIPPMVSKIRKKIKEYKSPVFKLEIKEEDKEITSSTEKCLSSLVVEECKEGGESYIAISSILSNKIEDVSLALSEALMDL